MTQEEELICRIKSEYILLRHGRLCGYGEFNLAEIEANFNKHLKEYKNLTGHNFQLEELINKLDNNYECD